MSSMWGHAIAYHLLLLSRLVSSTADLLNVNCQLSHNNNEKKSVSLAVLIREILRQTAMFPKSVTIHWQWQKHKILFSPYRDVGSRHSGRAKPR